MLIFRNGLAMMHNATITLSKAMKYDTRMKVQIQKNNWRNGFSTLYQKLGYKSFLESTQ